MKNRISTLAGQYQKTRRQYPDRKLMMVIDIDGTILDIRYMVVHVLKAFDQNHGTCYFNNLIPEDITVYEKRIYTILKQLNVPLKRQEEIVHWYNTYRWLSEGILRSHTPFEGMMDIIHWFMMQPDTFIGLNTSRPEVNRLDTYRMLNILGRAYNIRFCNNLIYMNPFGWGRNVPEVKAAGIEYFRQSGFHLFAMIDSDQQNLEAVSRIDIQQEILLLNTADILNITPEQDPTRLDKPESDRIICQIPKTREPRPIQLAWQNITDRKRFNRFINSGIQWAEFSVRLAPSTECVHLRQAVLSSRYGHKSETFEYMHYILDILKTMDRSVKIDLKEGGRLLDELFAMLAFYGFDDSRLWFSADFDVIGADGFRKLKKQYPTAILQCPVDHYFPNVDDIPESVDDHLSYLMNCGINRFSITWSPENMHRLKLYTDGLGVELNIDHVPDLDAFLSVALLMPSSVTAEFDFSTITDVLDGRIYRNFIDMEMKLPMSA